VPAKQTGARITAALAMKVEDYYTEGRRAWFRLHEKCSKRHKVAAHHNAEKYIDAYLDTAGIAGQKKNPLFRSIDTHRKLTGRPMDRNDALRTNKRRANSAGLSEDICCYTFRATGITAYLEDGGTFDIGQPYCLLSPPTLQFRGGFRALVSRGHAGCPAADDPAGLDRSPGRVASP
jgi:integrase